MIVILSAFCTIIIDLVVQPYSVCELLDPDETASRQALELFKVSFSSPAEPPYTHIDHLLHNGFYRLFVMFNEDGLVIACAYVSTVAFLLVLCQ